MCTAFNLFIRKRILGGLCNMQQSKLFSLRGTLETLLLVLYKAVEIVTHVVINCSRKRTFFATCGVAHWTRCKCHCDFGGSPAAFSPTISIFLGVDKQSWMLSKADLFQVGKRQESIVQIKFLGTTINSSGMKDARGRAHVRTFAFPLWFTCHLDEPCTIERIHHITCAVFVQVAHTAMTAHSCQLECSFIWQIGSCDNLGHCKWAVL